MFEFKKKKIIVLSPHPEDGEIGCGGTIQKFIQNGSECWYVVFTIAEDSTHPPFKKNAQSHEMMKSVLSLGFKKSKIIKKNWKVRNFPYHRQEILDFMIQLKKKIKPDIVFCHSTLDIHQDHQVICEEALRAFKLSNILGYELPWNLLKNQNNIFFEVNKKEALIKAKALSNYKSRSYRPYLKKNKILDVMSYRGLQIEKNYAEAFEGIRLIKYL
tara:strand:+ start:32 stop:676 length:645 start_codon:yes stop_codon:yes gene_type:complete